MPSIEIKRIIKKLVQRRLDKKMTQEDVGKKLGITRSAVCRFESGACEPRITTLRKYARAVGAQVNVDGPTIMDDIFPIEGSQHWQ